MLLLLGIPPKLIFGCKISSSFVEFIPVPSLTQELLSGGYRDFAMNFCRLRRLPPQKAEPLSERLEFLTRRLPAKSDVAKAKAKAKVRCFFFSGWKMKFLWDLGRFSRFSRCYFLFVASFLVIVEQDFLDFDVLVLWMLGPLVLLWLLGRERTGHHSSNVA